MHFGVPLLRTFLGEICWILNIANNLFLSPHSVSCALPWGRHFLETPHRFPSFFIVFCWSKITHMERWCRYLAMWQVFVPSEGHVEFPISPIQLWGSGWLDIVCVLLQNQIKGPQLLHTSASASCSLILARLHPYRKVYSCQFYCLTFQIVPKAIIIFLWNLLSLTPGLHS